MSNSPNQFAVDFGSFGGRIWLNCAHQGPLPNVAATTARRAVAEKSSPHLIRKDSFDEIPEKLRSALGQFIGKPASEIILGNSASYGIHLLANGIPWEEHDEILLVKGDFPANVYPWLRLRERGVNVRFVTPRNGNCIGPVDILDGISNKTKLVCLSWVNSFNGWQVDLNEVGSVCQKHGVQLVVNASQAIGSQRRELNDLPVHAVVCCGYKWLCGPYATGFCWLSPELLDRLSCNQTYWWPLRDWDFDWSPIADIPKLGCRQFDMFCTANHFNYEPWLSAIEYLLQKDFDVIAKHNKTLVDQMVSGLRRDKYRIVSPVGGKHRSSIFVASHQQSDRNPNIYYKLHKARIDIAIRKKNLRFSPHLYNTSDDIDRTLSVLNGTAE